MTTKAQLYSKLKERNPYVFLGLLHHEKMKQIVKIKKSASVEIIKKLLPEYYGYTWEEINVKTRVRPISDIKHHFIALVKETTDLSLMSIGAIFTYKENGIDHTTVLNSIKAWDNLIIYDKVRTAMHERFLSSIREIQLNPYLDSLQTTKPVKRII